LHADFGSKKAVFYGLSIGIQSKLAKFSMHQKLNITFSSSWRTLVMVAKNQRVQTKIWKAKVIFVAFSLL